MLEGQHFEPTGRLAQFMRVASDLDQVEIGFAIDTLIGRLDDAAGDPDLEDGGDTEPNGDERDASFPEWREWARDVPVFEKGMRSALDHEDAEDSDDDRCYAGDDHMIAGPVYQREWWDRHCWEIGDDVDAEPTYRRNPSPTYRLDQRRPIEAPATMPKEAFT